MKVSKVVLIVVALHVLVIGGIFIFEGCSRAKAPATEADASDVTKPAATDPTATDAAALPADTSATAQNSLAPAAAPAAMTPMPAAVAPVAPAPVAKTYVVKKGDTLGKIAKSQGTTQTELSKANHLTKTSVLKIGQKLTIPAKAEVAPTQVTSAMPMDAGVPPAAAPVAGNSYAVKAGDSLWKIAKANGISVTALKQANNLASDALKIGQKLTIPAATQVASAAPAAPTYSEWQPGGHVENGQTIHTVDIGESPAVIAKKYNVSVNDLMKANNISGTSRIMVGQKLVIPGAPAAAAAPAPTPTPTPAVAAPIVSINN